MSKHSHVSFFFFNVLIQKLPVPTGPQQHVADTGRNAPLFPADISFVLFFFWSSVLLSFWTIFTFNAIEGFVDCSIFWNRYYFPSIFLFENVHTCLGFWLRFKFNVNKIH